MPRPRTVSDADILAIAHGLAHEIGPDAVTFALLAAESGLSPATLVQRFGTKANLIQRTLLAAWDQLDERTATLAATQAKSPKGAIGILTALSGSYGEIDSHANGLRVLREDFRDPVLRARGAKWRRDLTKALDACFAGTKAPAGIGEMLASLWQGSLLWWGFEPKKNLPRYVEEALRRALKALLPGAKF